MKFLTDENIGFEVIKSLRQLGFDIKSILETNRGVNDAIVISLANKEKRILITTDKDFGELVYVNKFIHSGVILLRLKSDSSKNKLKVLKSLFEFRLAELEKAFTVVTESKVRIKKT
jgi:predicted nuclease of predicted toxin-antitoxin system